MCVCLPWYDHVHRSTRESSHAPWHGELDIQSTLWPSRHRVLSGPALGTLWPSTCGGVWAAKRATLAASGALWPCLSMSAPGVCLKGVSHSCRLDVGPGVESCVQVRISPPDPCRTRTYHWTWRPCFPVDVAQLPRNWTVGAAGCEAPTATVSASHVCPRPRKVRGASQL